MKHSPMCLSTILWGLIALLNVAAFIMTLTRGGEGALLVSLQGVTAVASLATFLLLIRARRPKEE